MVTLIGKQQIPVSTAKAGDIVVIPKLANAKTGDTLTAPDFKVTYDAIRFPQALLYTVALEPVKKGEEEKLASAVLKVAEEDPTCE